MLFQRVRLYGFPKSDLREIAMRNRMEEAGVWIALYGNFAVPKE